MRLPKTPPPIEDVFFGDSKTEEKQDLMLKLIHMSTTEVGKDRDNQYLHWETLKYKPLPEGIDTHEDWWYITKIRRAGNYRKLPFVAKEDKKFVYWIPDPLLHRLHEIDQRASGRLQISEEVTNPATRDRYLISSLIEESITSSQLEGASTTHKVAKAMLREQRMPRDKSERMIANNYRAMSFVREVADQPLSRDIILELHRLVTEETLEDESSVGRFRRPEESVAVYDERDNTILHQPPPAQELEGRIQKLCEFANAETEGGAFLHPVVRSIVLHFMIGYDHPFVDGNGRTARALYYWSMAKHGYWMMEFVSISTIIKTSPARYARSYLYTETDSNDVTYFLDFNLEIILQAIHNLEDYLTRKASEVRAVERLLGSAGLSGNLNHRQLAVLSHALRNPTGSYTIESHRNSHNVSYPTARSDLVSLRDLKLLQQHKLGNAFLFKVVDNVQERLEQLNTDSNP